MRDKELYHYFSSKGCTIIDDISAFNGVNNLFRRTETDEYDYIKFNYHEVLVDSETWLAVQDKKSHNSKFSNNLTAKNSWLVGLVKYAYCGYALNITYSYNVSHTIRWRYYNDSGYYRAKGCLKKRLKLRPDDVEKAVFETMKERLKSIKIAKKESEKPDRETENIKAEIIRINNEIKNLWTNLLMPTVCFLVTLTKE